MLSVPASHVNDFSVFDEISLSWCMIFLELAMQCFQRSFQRIEKAWLLEFRDQNGGC